MHVLKLALNKSIRMSDNEQGINKLQPNSRNDFHIISKEERLAFCKI